MSQTTRYNDADLAIFKAHVEQKIEKGKNYLTMLEDQIKDLRENKDSEGDWMDESSSTGDLEMLFLMESRQRKHLNDLGNSLIRIQNKSFGVCVVSGELIDKRRLMAVPTTSKSLESKIAGISPVKKEKPRKVKKKDVPNQVISKVIKRSGETAKPVDLIREEEDWFDEDDLLEKNGLVGEEDSNLVDEELDFDSLPSED